MYQMDRGWRGKTTNAKTADMINTIETGIDIEVLGGIDIGIEIDKSISGILILVLILLRRASNIEYHGMFTNHLCHEYF